MLRARALSREIKMTLCETRLLLEKTYLNGLGCRENTFPNMSVENQNLTLNAADAQPQFLINCTISIRVFACFLPITLIEVTLSKPLF